MTDRAFGAGEAGYEAEGFCARTRRQWRSVRTGLLPKLAGAVGHVPFAEDLLAAYYAVLDRRTPLHVRATLIGALAYFVMPIDAIPDVIAGLGFTDDAAVLIAALRMVGGSIQERHHQAARAWLDGLAGRRSA